MRKTYIAICATAALGLCLAASRDASAFPASDAGKAYAQTVSTESAATQVRYAGGGRIGGIGGRGVGLGRGVGVRGRYFGRGRYVGLGRGIGWRRWGWRRRGWGWGGYGLGLGYGGYGLGAGWGGGYAPATYGGCGCYRRCYNPCGCGGGLFGFF